MTSNYKLLRNYIKEVKSLNSYGKVDTLLGINIDKYFMPSVANVVGTNLSRYKIVKNGQFACNRMHVGRDKRLPIALSKSREDFIVSPAYDVFEIIDSDVLDAEYLMMWFTRKEFDRNAWFYTDGDVRGGLKWDDFCDMKLPIPDINTQRAIVDEYNTVIKRIEINNQLILKLEETAQTIYNHWFVDFEFPDKLGQPYKSNGGEMEWNDELDKEVPQTWNVFPLESLCDVKGGKRLPKGEKLTSQKNTHPYIKVADMGSNKFIVLNNEFEYVSDIIQKQISKYIVSDGDIIISIVGTIGLVRIIHKSLDKANLTENCVKLTNVVDVTSDYFYHFFNSIDGRNEIEMRIVGGVQGKFPIYNIKSISVLCPSAILIELFTAYLRPLNTFIQSKLVEKVLLLKLRNILLEKMTR